MKAQPKELYILNFVSMWECFSYYGMRVLLVLFMIHEFDLSDSQAFGFYALYTTLVEFGGIFGGVIADRYLGLKNTLFLGGWTIVCGHLSLIVPSSEIFFYLGLGLIIVGTSLFRSNIPALIGKSYEENDARLDAGYTLYYTGINFGGFLASVICGIVAEVYGYHAGFGLAAFGMIFGMLIFAYYGKYFKTLNIRPKYFALVVAGILVAAPLAGFAVYSQDVLTPYFPLVVVMGILYVFKQAKSCTLDEKKGLKKVAISVLFLIIFYGCEEQIGSTLILFATRFVHRETVFGIIPSASLVTFNPLTILLAGPLLAGILKKTPLKETTKLAVSFMFLTLAFLLVYVGCGFCENGQIISLGYLIGCIVLISLGELFIGPTIYAIASKNSPKKLQGLCMGMVTLGFSLSNLLSGILSQTMAMSQETASLTIYRDGFLNIVLLTSSIGVMLLVFNQYKKYKVTI
jgi:POT family proton-dependent oligopeptide transporter